MDWNKQAYLGISELKGRIDSKGSCNTLVLNRIPVDNTVNIDFKCQGRNIQIIVELHQEVLAIIWLDGCIVESDRSNLITVNTDTYNGDHKLNIELRGEYNDRVKITLTAVGIQEIVHTYEPYAMDNNNKILYLRDKSNNVYSVNIIDEYPVISSYNGIVINSVSYVVNGISIPVSAYIENGALKVNDNNVIAILANNVTSCTILKPLNDSYHYHIYYVSNNVMYQIEKGVGGYTAPIFIGNDSVERIVGSGDKAYLYKTTEGKWNAIEEGIYQTTITINKISIDSISMPAIAVDNDNTVYYVRGNKGYHRMNEPNATKANCDSMLFVNGKVIMIWNDRVRILEREVIGC